jgi:hypothetical protein
MQYLPILGVNSRENKTQFLHARGWSTATSNGISKEQPEFPVVDTIRPSRSTEKGENNTIEPVSLGQVATM